MPLVSVIIPAYNAEKFIAETVSSVQAQTISDMEIIIIDDCSTDKTAEIIERLAKEDERIVFIKGEKNQGVAKVRNKGLSLAKGKYVALLDSDDLWLKDKLERQIKLAEEKKADIVYCSYSMIDENGKKVCEDFLVPEKTDFESTLIKSVISCSTALMTNEVSKKYRFPTNMYHEDYALWLDILKDGNVAVGDKEVCAKYRLLQTSRSAGKLKCAYHRFRIYRDYLHLPFFKSLGIMYEYATEGFRKYKKL
ncbi:MAG: glycosyltransferase family 2 protein [Ruminococcaceae bacterium]|nr:glycosyltransferase family 2 protein [Oscillospiraceae bacterium]